MDFERVSFADLAGWGDDDLEGARAAFAVSLDRLKDNLDVPPSAYEELLRAASTAGTNARAFFEDCFEPWKVQSLPGSGLLTGYFEPEILASRTPTAEFSVPLHARPPDLATLVDESERGAAAPGRLTHMRRTAAGLEPMPTRRQIDEGALDGSAERLFYVADDIDRFIIQVQGSAALRLPDRTQVRVTYDGKNGHAYTSIGRYLVDRGEINAEAMSLAVLVDWLKVDLARARRTIWQNESYVFFREMPADESAGPIGILGTTLVPGRSLAVDPTWNPLGMPVFVDAPQLTHLTGQPFRRLMVAHDVGSAITGPQRGDVFVGTGGAAGLSAGAIKHPVTFACLRLRNKRR